MQKIIIHHLGPVEHCELEIKDFIVFTGPQASGKSTVAKSVYFFKNIKGLLFSLIRKQYALGNVEQGTTLQLSVYNRLIKEIRSNFLQIFGSTWCMDREMYLEYYYTEDTSVRIALIDDQSSHNHIWIELSDNFKAFLRSLDPSTENTFTAAFSDVFKDVLYSINYFFHDDAEIVYIPAGRSMITLLNSQLNYIYSSMDDLQKRNLDYCTQNYLERILQLKSAFNIGVEQMIRNTLILTDTKVNKEQLTEAADLMRKILQGEYRNVSGEERLQVSENRYVKINFASSGQQEVVWILNVLFYYLLNNRKAYFIIEEPESHLFPNAQKLITEFIALTQNNKNQVFITTHSPYVLGTINNLLYANKISNLVDPGNLVKIIPASRWLRFDNMSAYFINEGKVKSCVDDEFESIENEVIDGASDDINDDYDRMVWLKEKECSKEDE